MASEILVDADGYTLTDEAGFELDQTCVERCCAPAGECPTPCGRVWRVCVRKWRSVREEQYRLEGPDGSNYGTLQDYSIYSEKSMRPQDDGDNGPWRLDPVNPDSDGVDGPCQWRAAGLVPTLDVYELLSRVPPATDITRRLCGVGQNSYRIERRDCTQFGAWCTSVESQGMDPSAGEAPVFPPPMTGVVIPVSGVAHAGDVLFEPLMYSHEPTPGTAVCSIPGQAPWGAFSYTQVCTVPPIGARCELAITINNSLVWRYARDGISRFARLFTFSASGTVPVYCQSESGNGRVFLGCARLQASGRYEVEFEWEHSTLEDNDGNTFAGCNGRVPSDCIGDRVYIEGRACDRRGASRVYLPRENVRECGTIALGPAIDAEGRQACYRFHPHEGITPNLPDGATVYDAIVDKYSSAPDCCGCGARQSPPVCDAVDLREQMGADGLLKPNWLGWRRNAGGVLERVGGGGVLGINVAGVCCCRGSDVITVNFVESELTAFGVRELWKLREGRGLRARFRRDQRWPVGDPANAGGDPTFGQFVSDVFELLPDGSQGPQILPNGFAWGQALNEPQMPCEWTALLSDYFDFDRPHEAVGTWNNSQGTQFGRLAAPGDVDRDDFVNGFRLMEWTPYVTCQFFNFIGRYEHMNGGELVNRVRLTIERPEVVGDPCSGGCGQEGPGAEGRGPSVQIQSGSGCGGCGGGEDGRL